MTALLFVIAPFGMRHWRLPSAFESKCIVMKEFKLPSKLEDLENADSEFMTVSNVIDLESCDADECSAMLNSTLYLQLLSE